MRMPDVFNLPLKSAFAMIYEKDRNAGLMHIGGFQNSHKSNYAVHAINNHDRLVECIEELISDAQYAEDDECSTLFKAQALLAEIKGD